MKLYHGTLKNNGEKIIACKMIKKTDEENTQYATEGYTKTTYGYVYLSKSLNEALGFGLLAALKNRAPFDIIIFELNIKEFELENDLDEQKYGGKVTSLDLPLNSCVRISRDLKFKEDVIKYCNLKFDDYDHGCKYADSLLLDKIIANKWNEII